MVFGFFRKKRDYEINKIHSMMDKSFLNIKKDMGNLSSWVLHFKSRHENHEDSFEKIMKEMENIKKMFENHIEDHHSDIERSSVHERVQSFERSSSSFMNVQGAKSLKNKLTPSQKKVLRLFDKANIPLDYETIANELKLSVVTVRRHVNDIRKVFDIKEMRDIDRGRKVFYIDKKAKIRLKRKK